MTWGHICGTFGYVEDIIRHMRFSQLLLLSEMQPFKTPMGLTKDLWPVDPNFFFTESG